MIKNIILLWILIFSIISDFSFSQRSKKGKTLGNIGRYNLIEFSRAYSKDSILVTAFVDIPFQSLQFIKKEKSFFASYDVSISLTNNKDNKVLIAEDVGSDGFFYHKYAIDKDALSSIGINVGIRLTQSKKEKEVQKKISIYKPGLSGFVDNAETSFQQMKYILTNDERKNAKGKKGKELEQVFLSYWQKRDPTPKTSINELMEEYYIRVNYVNEYFNMSWKEGWETDFGMIYILFGPPDEIQRSNVNSNNASMYQVWYYNRLNKQFVFKDQNGFGDFKLDRPFIGPDF